MEVKDLNTPAKNTWCPGCGNFGILAAFKQALVEMNVDPAQVVIVTGIGCHGKISNYLKVNSFQSIHGRVIPVATAIKLSNHDLNVVGFSGDGDGYAIGIAHLIHAAKRNIDITVLVHNNQVFGLTTGQTTPTSERGFKSKSTPFGNMEDPLNPLAISLVSGASFVARGFAGDPNHLKQLIIAGMKHKGFALIDVLQPCVTFYNTFQLYREKCYKLDGHDSTNFKAALEKSYETEKIPIGIFYQVKKPLYRESIEQLSSGVLVKQKLQADISELINEFR